MKISYKRYHIQGLLYNAQFISVTRDEFNSFTSILDAKKSMDKVDIRTRGDYIYIALDLKNLGILKSLYKNNKRLKTDRNSVIYTKK